MLLNVIWLVHVYAVLGLHIVLIFAAQLESAIDELREKSEMEIAQYKQEMDKAYKE